MISNNPLLPSETDYLPRRHHWLNYGLVNTFIDLSIQVTYWTSKFALSPFLRGKFIALRPSDLPPGKHFVIAANHQSVVDPFLVMSQIPFSSWRRVVTVRYFLANYIFDNRLLRAGAISLGCFPAKTHATYPYGLDFALSQLHKGRSIGIFPEGRRTIRGEVKAHHGVQVLAAVPNTLIVPVHLEWKRSAWGRSVSIGIGKPFEGGTVAPEEILERIYAIPVE